MRGSAEEAGSAAEVDKLGVLSERNQKLKVLDAVETGCIMRTSRCSGSAENDL
jgi:hypothetical protein